MASQYFIAFISPNGSTRAIADIFKNQLAQGGQTVTLLDLAHHGEHDAFLKRLSAAKSACLLIGSPVYRDMAVPPVMTFIDRLPEKSDLWAVPFVTWGLACSGVALWQMGKALAQKRFRLAGAAKVAALHSMMWQSDSPAGAGHPGEADRQQIQKLADQLLNGFDELDPNVLDYQPAALSKEQKERLAQPWMVIPKTVDDEACSQCGVCEEECPVTAVALNPYPQFNDRCFDCFNCIRLCPENAIQSEVPIKNIEERILKRINTIDEQPSTQVFR